MVFAQGTFISDPAGPAVISPSRNSSQIYVLNRDLSIQSYSDSSTPAASATCSPFPGFQLTASIPLTLVNDGQNLGGASLYETGQSSGSSNSQAVGIIPAESPNCPSSPEVSMAGGIAAASLSTADAIHRRLSSSPHMVAMVRQPLDRQRCGTGKRYTRHPDRTDRHRRSGQDPAPVSPQDHLARTAPLTDSQSARDPQEKP